MIKWIWPSRRRGSVLVWFAVTMVPLILATGIAIDIARAYAVKIRLGAALDEAGLAVASTSNQSIDLTARLNQYFYGNYSSTGIGTPTSVTMVNDANDANVINLTATATVPTIFMRLAGFSSIAVAATAQVTKEPTGLEVALVLDNTGSMLDSFNGITNMAAMTADATQLVNILFGANANNTKLKMSLVPFVTTVNPGSLAPNLIAAGSLPTINTGTSKKPVWKTITYSATDATLWKGCLEEPNSPADQSESTAAGAWMPYWWPTDSTNNPWGAWPNNISVVLTRPSADDPTQSHSPDLSCGTPIQRLVSDKQTMLNAVNAMQAWSRSGTMIHVGMTWGWRTISPVSVFQTAGTPDAQPYNTPGWTKAVILETDGTDNFNQCGSCSSPDYTAFGYLSDGRLGTTSNVSVAKTTLDNRLAAVCAAMKAKGIVIYTIGFTGAAANSQTILQGCATDANKYFFAPDQATLQTAFVAIANSLNKIRLSK
ncbi:MAG TPA: TadE/TadG family type IV pilus assembly protein [Stellaceae bacterium]|nr:TadE/TadG family type IV pilus assembly protein [Stellaceae bacterium]